MQNSENRVIMQNPKNCMIHGSSVKQVDGFKYLNTIVVQNGSLNLEFDKGLKKTQIKQWGS